MLWYLYSVTSDSREKGEMQLSLCIIWRSLTCVCSGHQHRSRNSCWRQQEDDSLRHRHDEMHLLRLLSGGVSCGCYCRGVCACSPVTAQWDTHCVCKASKCFGTQQIQFLMLHVIWLLICLNCHIFVIWLPLLKLYCSQWCDAWSRQSISLLVS